MRYVTGAFGCRPAGPSNPAVGGVPPAGAAERPNILLVNLDDARLDAWQYLPKTTAWMSSGVNFVNIRVAIPSCCPSRASLFTGRYPRTTA